MMMLGTKSAEILDLILDWSNRNIRNQPKKDSCSRGRKGGGGGHDE
jgi:hypothetical protein